MVFKRVVYLSVFLLMSLAVQAQINIYLGGNLQGNVSWVRGDEPSMEPGFGAGLDFVYWEYEYWFLKAGLDYYYKTSSALDYPDDFGVEPENADDMIRISYAENSIGIPLTVYFRPFEKGANTLLLTGSLTTRYVVNLKAASDEYGELVLKGKDVDPRIKANVGAGIGYQLQLDRHKYLNIIPSFNTDLRGKKAFNSITLTAELIFGVY